MELAQIQNRFFPEGNPLSPGNKEVAVTTFGQILASVIGILFVVGIIAFFFLLIIGAIRWIVSGGDKAQIEAARSMLLNAFVGLVILFSLFAILKVLETLFGINILQINIGNLKIE